MTAGTELIAVRAALQALVHELYFKSSHFPGLSGHSPRNLMDEDMERIEVFDETSLFGQEDPFTKLLSQRAKRVPGKHPDALMDTWQRAESTLNARMRAIFGTFCGALPRQIQEILVGEGPSLPPLQVSPGRNPIGGKRSDKLFGQPDIVLVGGTTAVTIEMKVRGGRARATYDATQHFKYLRLAEALRTQGGLSGVYHVLLAPLGGGRVVKNSERWLNGSVSHSAPLQVSIDGLISSLPARWQDSVRELGGTEWLDEVSRRMPTRAVDLATFLGAISTTADIASATGQERVRQVEALKRFALWPVGRGEHFVA